QGVLRTDDDAAVVDWEPPGIGHQVARRRVDELERRALVATRCHRLELVCVRIRRTRRQGPTTPWKGRIDNVRGGETADADRCAVPEPIVDRQLPAGGEIEGRYRDPGDAPFRKTGRKVVT